MSDFRNVDNYNVTVLEWYCDLNLSAYGIEEGSALEEAWIGMISLPNTMDALVLDPSFDAIMLFDEAWCQTFVLGKQHAYREDLQELLAFAYTTDLYSYPSQQWFGSYHCTHSSSISMSLLFESFFWRNGTGTAWLLGGDEPVFLRGNINFEERSATLWNEDENLEFVGLVTLMQDGTVLYSGSVNADDCSGFVFKGWLDTTPFESAVDSGTSTGPWVTTSRPDEALNECEGKTSDANEKWIGLGIGLGAALIVMLVVMMVVKLMGYSVVKVGKANGTYNLMYENSNL